MHKASAEYFKQRSLYSRAELDRCQALSHQSDRKIRTAQVSVHIRVKTGGGGGGLLKVYLRCWIPSFNFYARCRFSSKRRRVPFIPQWLRITLGIVWASPGQPAALCLLCQAGAARRTSARRPASVKDAALTLQSLRSLIRGLTWWMARLPEHLCSGSVS